MSFATELAMKVTVLDDASQKMQKLTQLSDVFGKSFDEAKKEAEKFSKTINDTFKNVGGIDKFSEQMNVSKEEMVRITKEMQEKVSANMERMRTKIQEGFNSISRYAKYASVAVVGFSGVALKQFASYEAGVIKAQTITNDSFGTIDKNIRSMAKSMGISVQELNEGLYQTVSAVGDVSGKYSILSESAKLAIGGFTTTNQAVDIMTTVLNAYGMKAEEVTKISDILIQTQNKGKTTVNQLAGTLGNVIPTAAATGTKLEEVAVAMALLTANGISTDEAGTAVNAMLTELAMNSTKAGKLFKSAFGTSFNDYMKQGGSLVEALKGVQEQANKTGDALIDVFNRRSFKAAQSLTGASGDRVTAFTDAIYNSSGSAEKAFEKMQTSMTRQMMIMKERLNEVALSIGQALLPQVQSFTSWLSKIDFGRVFSKEHINTIIALGKAVITLYTALKAISVMKGISNIFNGFISAKTLLMGTTESISAISSASTTAISSLGGIAKAAAVAKSGLGTLMSGLGINPMALGITAVVGGLGYLITSYYQAQKAIKDTAEELNIFNKEGEEFNNAVNRNIEVMSKLYTKMKDNKEITKENKTEIEALARTYPEIRKAVEDLKFAEQSVAEQRSEKLMNDMYTASAGIEIDESSVEEARKKLQDQISEIGDQMQANKLYVDVKIQMDDIDKQISKFDKFKDLAQNGYFMTIASDANLAGTAIQQLAQKFVEGTGSAEDFNLLLEMIDEGTNRLEQRKINIEIANKEALESTAATIDRLTQVKNIIDVVLNITNVNSSISDMASNINKSMTSAMNLGLKSSADMINKTYDNSVKSLKTKYNALKSVYANSSGDLQNELDLQLTSIEKKLASATTGSSKKTGSGGSGKASVDEAKKAVEDYQKWAKTQPSIWEALGTDDLAIAKEKSDKIKSVMETAYRNGNKTLGDSFREEYNKMQTELSTLEFSTISKNMKDEFDKLPTIADILGLDDTEILKRKISALQKSLQDMLEKGTGLNMSISDITGSQKYSDTKDQLKDMQDQLKASEAVEKAKKEEAEAGKKIISTLSDFGSNMKSLGEDLHSSFLTLIGEMSSALSTTLKGLEQYQSSGGLGSIGSMFSSIGGLFTGGGFGGLSSIVSGISSLSGIGTAVSGVVGIASSAISALSGSDKKKKLEEKSKQQEEAYDQATSSLIDLVQSIENAASRITEFSSSMVSLSSVAPTIDRVTKAAGNFDKYINAILINKTFGNLNVLYQDTAKYSSWFSSKSLDVSKNTKMDRKVLDSLGWGNTSIELMGKDELKKLNEQLSSFGKNDLENLLGKDIIKTDLETWKEGIREYVQQIEKLEKAQKELMKNATLSDFSGIDYQSQASLVEQYRSSFEEMGLKADDYMDTINEMANANQVLVTSMQDVRNAYVEALSSGNGTNFSDNMGSYFKALLENAAKVTYDVAYSSIDSYMSNEFSQMSDKLVSMKENGVLNFSGFWDDFNFNKILEGDRIQTQYDTVINDLRLQLESRGFSQSLIDSILPATELSERIESIKDMLNSAMNSAITSGSFDDFSSSLGQSIYDSVKNSLITAFTDSEVYKQYIDRFFNTAEIEQQLNSVSSAQDGFNVIQDYLNNLDYQLQAAGLARGDSLLSTDDTTSYLGNGYYTDTSSGLTIQITQYFTGVYGEQTMYDIAKQGVADGLNEWQTSAGTLGTIGTTSAAVS